jgi:hypothetical protein
MSAFDQLQTFSDGDGRAAIAAMLRVASTTQVLSEDRQRRPSARFYQRTGLSTSGDTLYPSINGRS